MIYVIVDKDGSFYAGRGTDEYIFARSMSVIFDNKDRAEFLKALLIRKGHRDLEVKSLIFEE